MTVYIKCKSCSTLNYERDDDGIFAYSVPRFRFMSLYADGKGGKLTTKELIFECNDIYLNFSTSSYGYLKIRILDTEGKEYYSSEEIYGNSLSRELHIEGLNGKCGRMEIELYEANLYAIGRKM